MHMYIYMYIYMHVYDYVCIKNGSQIFAADPNFKVFVQLDFFWFKFQGALVRPLFLKMMSATRPAGSTTGP